MFDGGRVRGSLMSLICGRTGGPSERRKRPREGGRGCKKGVSVVRCDGCGAWHDGRWRNAAWRIQSEVNTCGS